MSSVNRSRKLVRQSRALGIALTPKAEKVLGGEYTHRKRRNCPPGQHGKDGRRKNSDYAIRLKEKQRLRAQYQLKEKQLRAIYDYAKTRSGLTGETMVEELETRLDAVVLRSGFARTILQARQAVVHGHMLVDGQPVDRPSFRVKPGQTVMVRPKSQVSPQFKAAALGAHRDVLPPVPEYLNVNLEKLSTVALRRPTRQEIPVICEEQLVVEFYAR
jgi:small subunit ribosomal protein S4